MDDIVEMKLIIVHEAHYESNIKRIISNTHQPLTHCKNWLHSNETFDILSPSMDDNKKYFLIAISVIFFLAFPVYVTFFSGTRQWGILIFDYLVYLFLWVLPVVYFFKMEFSNRYFVLLSIVSAIIFTILVDITQIYSDTVENNNISGMKRMLER